MTEEQSGRERDEPKPDGSGTGLLRPAARRCSGRRSPPSVPRGSIPAEELSRRRQKGMGATGSGGAGWALFRRLLSRALGRIRGGHSQAVGFCCLPRWRESEEVSGGGAWGGALGLG
jgi:hypothetical protein